MGELRQRLHHRQSTAWADTPRSSSVHCECCDRVFAAGHLPVDGVMICRDCRIEAAANEDPRLF